MKRNTEPRERILDTFINNKEYHIDAEYIMNKAKISKATLYRNLKKMEKENIIRKYYFDGEKKACYQYNNCNEDKHYHLICENCQNVFHFQNNNMLNIKKEIKDESNFSIALEKIIFYGNCNKCENKEKNE